MTRHELDRHVRVLAAIDWVFKILTPVFCAVVVLAILFTTLWRSS